MDAKRIAKAKRWAADRAEAWGALERYYQPEWVLVQYINELEAKVSLVSAEVDRLRPYESAIRERHNSFNPAAREAFGIEREPTPLEAIDELVDEADALARAEGKILYEELQARCAAMSAYLRTHDHRLHDAAMAAAKEH